MTAPLCRLDDRAVLAVSGEDRFDFLNTLLSADVAGDAGGAAFAALLTPQGKLLADVLCYTDRDEDRILIDFPAGSDFDKRLRMYKLRAAVDLALLEDWGVGVALPQASAALQHDDEQQASTPHPGADQPGAGTGSGAVTFADPRSDRLGWRVLGADLNIAAGNGEAAGAGSRQDYDRARIAAVVPEGPVDLKPNKALLMESGFERLGGVDFRKGCYVGQEVTARMKYRNLGKKRLMALSSEAALQPGDAVLAGERPAGEVLTAVGGAALGLMRHEAIGERLRVESGVAVSISADPDAVAA